MNGKKEFESTKQLDLSNWIDPKKNRNVIKLEEKNDKAIVKKLNEKPKMAFGYGYNPESLKQGITNFFLSHTLNDNIKLFEFNPKISYRIFKTLAKIIHYKFVGTELRKNNTIIKNHYFTTDQDPEQIINEINVGIKTIFEIYDPIPEYDV